MHHEAIQFLLLYYSVLFISDMCVWRYFIRPFSVKCHVIRVSHVHYDVWEKVFMEPVSAPTLLHQVGKTPRQTQPATRPGAQKNYSPPTDHTG